MPKRKSQKQIFNPQTKLLVLSFSFALCVFIFVSSPKVGAYVASSANYQIERDSINFAGRFSTSTNYGTEDTLGEVGTGRLTSAGYIVRAGYQQPNAYVSITSPADVTLSPDINKQTGGVATGQVTWKVTTDSVGGYTLSVQAATLPALKSAGSAFGDYTPAGAVPDYTWSVGAGSAEFGFTPEGTDISSTYKDNGSACAVGAGQTTSACWDGFSTSAKVVARRASPNDGLGGTDTTVRLQAEAGANSLPASGVYTALITATALAL